MICNKGNPLSRILLISLIFLFSCNKEHGEKIDQSYLDSNGFQSFQRKYQNENKTSLRDEKQFTEFLNRSVTEAVKSTLQMPFTIDEKFINHILEPDNIAKHRVSVLFGTRQRYYPLGSISGNHVDYYFFMLCKVTSYQECAIWLATRAKGHLAASRIIAPYTQTISYSEVPTIHIYSHYIRVNVDRTVKYPLEVHHQYSIKYSISSGGEIYQTQNKVEKRIPK